MISIIPFCPLAEKSKQALKGSTWNEDITWNCRAGFYFGANSYSLTFVAVSNSGSDLPRCNLRSGISKYESFELTGLDIERKRAMFLAQKR
jgi:hypothetical protein